MARFFEEVEIHHILQLSAAEKGGELVRDDLAFFSPHELEAMKIQRCAHRHAFGSNLTRDPKDEVLNLFAIHRLAGEKVEIIRPKVVEVEKPECTAPR